MSKLEKSARLTVAIGIASILAIVLCHLALTDIWHGEQAVETEWKIVQVGFAIILAFHAAALLTAYHALKAPDRSG